MRRKLIIQTCGIRKAYGTGDIQVIALDGVDLQIDEGEFVAAARVGDMVATGSVEAG